MNKKNSDFKYRIRFFRRKLIPRFICIILASILINSIICNIVKNTIRQRSDEDSEKFLAQSMYTFSSIINEIYTLTLLLTYDSTISDTIRDCLRNPHFIFSDIEGIQSMIITPVVATREYIESIYVYFENDNDFFIANNEGIRSLKTYYDNNWFDSIRSSENMEKNTWSEQRSYQKTTGFTHYVVSLYQRNLYGDGIIVLNLNRNYLNDLLSGLVSYDGQIIYVINEHSDVIFTSSEDPLTDYGELFDLTGSGTPRSQNPKYRVSYQKTDVAPSWTIVSAIPYDSLYAPISRINRFIVITIVLSCTIASFIVLQQVKRFYESINRIMTFIQEVKENPEAAPIMCQQPKDYEFIVESIVESSIRESELKHQLLENQYQNKVLELKGLQSQINPHFLLNTLQSIFWASFQLTGKYNIVSEMIENLNTILGYLLRSNELLISIEDEIRVLKSYLLIFKARHNNPFEIVWDIPDGDYSNNYIGKMILQPFLENAILHGFVGIGRDDFLLRISLCQSDSFLQITIDDNVVGMSDKELEKIHAVCRPHAKSPSTHIGIYNSNRRLYLIYENKYQLTFDSDASHGTTVHLSLPIIRQS